MEIMVILFSGNKGSKVFCWFVLRRTFILKGQTEICTDEMKRYPGLLQKNPGWGGMMKKISCDSCCG